MIITQYCDIYIIIMSTISVYFSRYNTQLSKPCMSRKNSPLVPLDACSPHPVISHIFSQQLIDVLSCGHSWPRSLANISRECYCRSWALSLAHSLSLVCHVFHRLCHTDFWGRWSPFDFDTAMPLTDKSNSDMLPYSVLALLRMRCRTFPGGSSGSN